MLWLFAVSVLWHTARCTIIFAANNTLKSCYRNPVLLVTPNNSLLCFIEERYRGAHWTPSNTTGDHSCSDNYGFGPSEQGGHNLGFARSEDGGLTWSPLVRLAGNLSNLAAHGAVQLRPAPAPRIQTGNLNRGGLVRRWTLRTTPQWWSNCRPQTVLWQSAGATPTRPFHSSASQRTGVSRDPKQPQPAGARPDPPAPLGRRRGHMVLASGRLPARTRPGPPGATPGPAQA